MTTTPREATSLSHRGEEASAPDGLGPLYLLGLAMLGAVALLSTHVLLFHLHSVLVPFVLSAFLVLAVEPYVEGAYRLLAGRSWTGRWCGCCCRRRKAAGSSEEGSVPRDEEERTGGDEEALTEESPLLGSVPGQIEQTADGLCRFLAVTLVLLSILCILFLLGLLLFRGAMQMRDSREAYELGARRLMKTIDGFIDSSTRALSVSRKQDQRLKEAYNSMVDKAYDSLWVLLNAIVSQVSVGVSVSIIMLLYVLFWLFRPLPLHGKASALVQNYIGKKSLVSALYGTSVALLFVSLRVDLAILFGVISFFLNFVPEVGALISMILPIPLILLDGRLENPFLVLLLALGGQMLLKFVFSNVLEVELIERDREMNIHPVWVMLGLSYFGFVWGPIGMLLSVPIMAMVKSAALSAQVSLETDTNPSVATLVLKNLISCLEGRSTEQHSSAKAVPSRH